MLAFKFTCYLHGYCCSTSNESDQQFKRYKLFEAPNSNSLPWSTGIVLSSTESTGGGENNWGGAGNGWVK